MEDTMVTGAVSLGAVTEAKAAGSVKRVVVTSSGVAADVIGVPSEEPVGTSTSSVGVPAEHAARANREDAQRPRKRRV